MPYRVESAATGRAGCNGNKYCKGTKITKGELRFGTWAKIGEHEGWKWRHWGCVTKKVLDNVKKEAETPDELDGYSDLPDEFQEKIRRAYEIGDVDPEDLPDTAKPPPADDNPEGEGEEAVADGDEKPKKKPAKKAKKATEDGEEGDEKPKKAPRKRKAKTEDDDDDEKPKKAPRKRKTKAEKDAEDDEEEVMPKKTSRKSKKADKEAETEEAGGDEE